MKIKSFFAAILFVASFIQNSSAQSNLTAAVSFGGSYSNLRSDLFTTQNGRAGYSAGLSFLIPVSNRFELNPEIAFVQKGASAKAGSILPEQKPTTTAFNYYYKSFSFGVLAGIQPIEGLALRLQVGGFLDANSNNITTESNELYVGDLNKSETAMEVTDLNRAFGGLDMGPVAGISIGNGRFRANLRYYRGMTNLYNYLEFMPEGHSIKTSSLRLTASYFLF